MGVWQVFSGNLGNGLWIAFIGWFLKSAAASQVQQQTLHDALVGHKVSDVMNRNFTVIPPDATPQQLLRACPINVERDCPNGGLFVCGSERKSLGGGQGVYRDFSNRGRFRTC